MMTSMVPGDQPAACYHLFRQKKVCPFKANPNLNLILPRLIVPAPDYRLFYRPTY